jgi:hypothetical protein
MRPVDLSVLMICWINMKSALPLVGIQNLMKELIEFAQAPGGSVLFLTVESQFSGAVVVQALFPVSAHA